MPFAITLCLDAISASVVEEMWGTLAAQGIDADCTQLGYMPHVTLAIYPDDAPVDRLRVALEQAAEHWRALPITLSGLGIFPGPSSIVWAAPVVTSDLLASHAALQAALPELQVHPHYQRNAWMPHVTLSGALSDPGQAITALVPFWRPASCYLHR